MIALSDLKTAFASYSYFYGSAPIGTSLPYLVAQQTGSDNFAADNKVYSNKYELTLEYYTTKKDEDAEESIEAILDSLGVFWDKTEAHDDDQEFYLITYSFWR